jgi:exopolyphosphatase/guanosine-5'-triphosphate,3'-diphosphate pyrophosphatase
LRLAVILRLAVLLHRARSPQPLPHVSLQAEGRKVVVALPARWMEDHSLIAADLQSEVDELSVIGMELVVRVVER